MSGAKTQFPGSPYSVLRAAVHGVLFIGFLTTIVPTMRLRHQFTWTPVDALVTSIGEKCGYYYRERQAINEGSKRTERWGNWQLGDIVDCTSFVADSNKYPDREWNPTPFPFTGVKFVLNGETKELFVNAQVMTPYPVEKGSILHVVVDTGPSFKMDRRFIWRDFFLLFRNLGFALIVAGLLEHLHRRYRTNTTSVSSKANTVVRTRQLG